MLTRLAAQQALRNGALDEGVTLAAQALKQARAAGVTGPELIPERWTSLEAALAAGELSVAHAFFAEATATCSDYRVVPLFLSLGAYLRSQGQDAAAVELCRRAVLLAQQFGSEPLSVETARTANGYLAQAVHHMGIAIDRQDAATALQCFEKAAELFGDLGEIHHAQNARANSAQLRARLASC